MKYYHIDRSNALSEGQIININKEFTPNNDSGKLLIKKLFPDGVSAHGMHYLNDNVYFFDTGLPLFENIATSNNYNSIYFAEYTFELVRRTFFPLMPSRYTSLFALKKLDEINQWPELTNSRYRIFEIETIDEFPVFDANLMKGGLCFNLTKMYQGFSPSLNFKLAFSYWNGEISETPKPEVLLPLPITVGKQIIV